MVRVRGDRYMDAKRKKGTLEQMRMAKIPLISQLSLGSMLSTVISDGQTETVDGTVCVCWDEWHQAHNALHNLSWAFTCFLFFHHCWLCRKMFMIFQFHLVDQVCPTLCNHMDCSTPGFPVHYQLPELAETHVHRVSDAIQPSHPLLSSSPAFNLTQNQDLF